MEFIPTYDPFELLDYRQHPTSLLDEARQLQILGQIAVVTDTEDTQTVRKSAYVPSPASPASSALLARLCSIETEMAWRRRLDRSITFKEVLVSAYASGRPSATSETLTRIAVVVAGESRDQPVVFLLALFPVVLRPRFGGRNELAPPPRVYPSKIAAGRRPRPAGMQVCLAPSRQLPSRPNLQCRRSLKVGKLTSLHTGVPASA